MAKEESFFSKHKDTINAAGHAINTLQNQKIAERQRQVAKLQAATAALQKEENELKKKELNLLEKQQKTLEKEQKRRRKEEQKRRDLRAELLDLAPKMASHLDKVSNSNYQDKLTCGKDLYEANCVMAYLNSNKGVVEDINFHDYLFDLNTKLAECNKKYTKSYEIFDQYLEQFQATLSDQGKLFNTIQILLNEYETKDIREIEEIFRNLKNDENLRSNLLEELQEYKSLIINHDFRFNEKRISLPLSEDRCIMLIDFLKLIKNDQFFNEEVLGRISGFEVNSVLKQKTEFLKTKRNSTQNEYKGINLSEITDFIKNLEHDNANEELIKNFNTELSHYVKHTKKILSENYLNRFFRKKTNKENKTYFLSHYKKYLKQYLDELSSKTQISFETDINNEFQNKWDKKRNKVLSTWLTIGFVAAIVLLIFGLSHNPGEAHLGVMGGIMLGLAFGIGHYFIALSNFVYSKEFFTLVKTITSKPRNLIAEIETYLHLDN